MLYDTLRCRASLAALALGLSATTAQAQVPSVVADLPVTHSLAAMVMGDLGAPVLILDRGSDAHDFALRPSQARAIAEAGLTVWMGDAMSPWMGRAVAGLAPGAAMALLEVEGIAHLPFRDQALFAAEEDGHDHGHDHAHDEGHDHGETDPHAWLDPDNARVWLSALADRLAAIDPANADTYRANARAAAERITAAEAEVRAILAPVGDAGIVVHHDAYGYFAESFGVNVLGSVALGDAADPGAQRLATIRDGMAQAGVVCVFPEVNHPEAFSALLTEGSALRIGAPLDPEGVMMEPGAELYPTMLRSMAQAIADCVKAG